jgi:hypothetical protein
MYEDEEAPQSGVAAEMLRFALERLKKKQQNRNKTPDNAVEVEIQQPTIVFTHQFLIVSNVYKDRANFLDPKKRKASVLESQNDVLVASTTSPIKSQLNVDILCWFIHMTVDMGACCLASIKFLPCSQYDEERNAQADMYASNIQILHKKPCLSIDICGGMDIANWTCSVRALAKRPKHLRNGSEQYHWDNSPLYHGNGISAIVRVAAGLLACPHPSLPNQANLVFVQVLMVGFTDNKVFKAYDGATNRIPNFALIQRYIDKEAVLWESSEDSLKIVEMIRRENDWKGELKVAVFMSILEKLSGLHDASLVHGDIRLARLLSSGCIVDFDFVGLNTYQRGLNDLTKDGKRHGPDVVSAIYN